MSCSQLAYLALCDEGSHLHQLHQVKIYSPNDTQAKYKEQSATNVPQPALKVRLAASSKRNGDEWAWVVNVAPTAAAVWDERTCEVAGDAKKAGSFGRVIKGSSSGSCHYWCRCWWRAPPSSSPSHFTEHDTYDQELGRPMRVKG